MCDAAPQPAPFQNTPIVTLTDPTFVCTTCGTQYPPSPVPPTACPICDDERQYVPGTGQGWTTFAQLPQGHRNAFQRLEPQLLGIGTTPAFGIGQRALLLRTPAGNVLWDCVSLLDDATIDIISALGGLHAIAISHPHYYASMVEWSRAFGQVPIYLHAADRAHVVRPDAAMHFWDGRSHALLPGLQLVQLGGHFAGGTVLQWDAGADGRGALLTGDIIQVIPDRRYVGFMRSYPNFIPLPPQEVERMAHVAHGLRFDRIYGAWWDAHITHDAHAIVQRSAARYATWSRGMPTP
jgi:hypothetical protein